MLRNFLTIALRNIYKNALYSSINIFGLAIGIMCTILIVLWVVDEISYDRFIPKSDRLYQVYANAEFDGKINSWRSVPLPTYGEMKVRDNNIVRSSVTGWGAERLIRYGETRMMKNGLYVLVSPIARS